MKEKLSNPKRAVAYARFSTEMQREESIDAQLRAIREYVVKNNLMLCGEYIDRAKSATSDQRPEFQRMIHDAEKGLYDVVIVHKLDRFSRDRYDSAVYKRRLRIAGVHLYSVLENLDNSPESAILESVIEGVNEYYSRNLAREVEKGKRENARKGLHVGGVPPLGYDVEPKTKKLIINEQEAEAVCIIFDMFLNDYGYTKIRDALNSQGFYTKRGGPFGKNSLHEILRNEKYTGTYVYNRLSSKSASGKYNRHKYKSPEEIIRIPNCFPAIISKEDYDAVQRKFKKRQHKGARNKAKEPYLLSGKIVCGKCGSSFVGNHRKAYGNHIAYSSYRCNCKNRAIKCNNKEISKGEIEGLVLEILSEKLFDERLLPRLEQEYNSFLGKQETEDDIAYNRLIAKHKQLTKEIANIVTVMAQTASIALADKLSELEQQNANVMRRLNEIEDRKRENVLTGEHLKIVFREAKALLVRGGLQSKQALVDSYIDCITVFEEHIEVKLKLAGAFSMTMSKDRRRQVE